MLSFLDELRKRYPKMELEDDVKAIFQSMLGVGHLLADEAAVINRLRSELERIRVMPFADDAPLTDDLGSHYCRLNLRPADALGIRSEWIARMMLASRKPEYSRADVYNELQSLGIHQEALDHILDDSWLPNHSAACKKAYAPAYRVIDKCYAVLLPVLAAIASCHDERLLITVDGPCGCGKTTVASQLASVIHAQVIHTDDFVIPHALKTPERLAQPGGNEDHERILAELIRPWIASGSASVRPYICHQDRLGEPIVIDNSDLMILEGSYSNMPELRTHASVRVWIDLSRDEQLKRLSKRENEASMAMFLKRWIPLEDAYHQAFALPDDGCIRINGNDIIP